MVGQLPRRRGHDRVVAAGGREIRFPRAVRGFHRLASSEVKAPQLDRAAAVHGADHQRVVAFNVLRNEGLVVSRCFADFTPAVAAALRGHQLTFIGVKVSTERTPVAPFPIDEVENKYRFVRHVEKTEKIVIFKTTLPASYS